MVTFDCGNKSLNDFLCSEEVKKYDEEQAGKTTLVFCDGDLAAYYTICFGHLGRVYMKSWKGFSRAAEMHVENIPALVIGRLAVALKHQSEGIGSTLVQKIAMFAVDHSTQAGLRLLLVQSKETAFPFYEQLGFQYASDIGHEKKRYKSQRTRSMFLDLVTLDEFRPSNI